MAKPFRKATGQHECPDCETPFAGPACPVCGWRATKDAEGPRRTTCDCGGPLLASGICQATGDYPLTASCQIACPLCGGKLVWSGACFSCHGAPGQGREAWTIPGDRYEQIGGHWHRAGGPSRAMSKAEVQAAMREVASIFAGELPHSVYGLAGPPMRRRLGLYEVDPEIRRAIDGPGATRSDEARQSP